MLGDRSRCWEIMRVFPGNIFRGRHKATPIENAGEGRRGGARSRSKEERDEANYARYQGRIRYGVAL